MTSESMWNRSKPQVYARAARVMSLLATAERIGRDLAAEGSRGEEVAAASDIGGPALLR